MASVYFGNTVSICSEIGAIPQMSNSANRKRKEAVWRKTYSQRMFLVLTNCNNIQNVVGIRFLLNTCGCKIFVKIFSYNQSKYWLENNCEIFVCFLVIIEVQCCETLISVCSYLVGSLNDGYIDRYIIYYRPFSQVSASG